jgi:hypothetical protein
MASRRLRSVDPSDIVVIAESDDLLVLLLTMITPPDRHGWALRLDGPAGTQHASSGSPVNTVGTVQHLAL